MDSNQVSWVNLCLPTIKRGEDVLVPLPIKTPYLKKIFFLKSINPFDK